jgi:hypothetical protein
VRGNAGISGGYVGGFLIRFLTARVYGALRDETKTDGARLGKARRHLLGRRDDQPGAQKEQ